MCGRFSQGESHRDLAEIFGAEIDDAVDFPDGKWNVAPTDPIRIVVERDGARRLTPAGWGFRPFWLDRSSGQAPQAGWINAKAETAFDSPAFAPSLRAHRCIIPADAFYEWDRSHRPPQPYAIGPAEGAAPLALAGIWTSARDGALPTAAILTTGPNRVMAPLHHRMPVILGKDDVGTFLAGDAPLEVVASLLVPAPEQVLRVWPVTTAVNSVRNDGPELLRPVGVASPTLGLA